jgi:hypothetical protein
MNCLLINYANFIDYIAINFTIINIMLMMCPYYLLEKYSFNFIFHYYYYYKF